MKIEITEKLIEQGEPGEVCRCPIALAINAILPPTIVAEVDNAGSEDERLGEIRFYRVDSKSKAMVKGYADLSAVCIGKITLDAPETTWINAFDEMDYVAPFSFELAIPEGVL